MLPPDEPPFNSLLGLDSILNLASLKVRLRNADQQDKIFLRKVYASTRTEEMAQVDWPPEEKEQFLRMQFEAQDRHYRAHYPGAEFRVIEIDGHSAGRLYLHESEAEIRIMDIALLPQWRGRGIGTALLSWLTDGAGGRKRLTIHVEIFNPAKKLYERLGFKPVAEHGVYILMEWNPSASQLKPNG